MKVAVLSVSKTGAKLGAKIKEAIAEEVVLYERHGSESGKEAIYFKKTLSLVSEIFTKYDGIIFIMASGIAVRAIAPHVVSKASDPAVLVMDELGNHCISLLSGHLGGANDLARRIGLAVGADPVITTATDVHGRKAPDDLARELMMRIEPLAALKPVNSVIAEGKPFVWFLDYHQEGSDSIEKRLSDKGIFCMDVSKINETDFEACAIISENNFETLKPLVYLRPKNLFVGIGCKRGTSEELIENAFEEALKLCGGYAYQVKSIASVTLKSDEKGLLDFAKHHNFPIHFYEPNELKKIEEEYHLSHSKFVEKTIGVGNVCQTSALMESRQGKVLLEKTKFVSATVAIATGLSV